MTLRTTSRSASAGSAARYVFPEAPAAELGHQPERPEVFADFRENRDPGKRPQQAVAAQEDLELIFPMGEPADDLGSRDLLSRLSAEANLLVDEPDGRLIVQPRVPRQDLLRGLPLAAAPGRSQRIDLAREPGAVRPATGR